MQFSPAASSEIDTLNLHRNLAFSLHAFEGGGGGFRDGTQRGVDPGHPRTTLPNWGTSVRFRGSRFDPTIFSSFYL